MSRIRSGLSLIELLVAIGIVGVLAGLVLPAAARARENARRLQCANQLRQIGIAMIGWADAKRRLPASGYFSAVGPEQYHNWVVELLPGLGHQDIQDQWDFQQPHTDATQSRNRPLADTPIAVLACPSDDTVVPGKGNLSYVVNGGFGWTAPVDCPVAGHWAGSVPPHLVMLDLNGDGVICPADPRKDAKPADRELFSQTGLFFGENWPVGSGTVRHHSLRTIRDGTSQTILLSENVRAGYDPYYDTNWASPEPWRNSFFLSSYVCENARCAAGQVDYDRANARSGDAAREAINASLTQPEGEAPWLSSFHTGGVNIVMCDGAVRFLSEAVHGKVLASLVSPQGAAIRGPLAQGVLSDSDY